MNEERPDDLVTLMSKPTEFEAHTVVAVLEENGIEAVAFGAMRAVLPLSEKLTPVPIQVRRRDLERARAVIKQNIADSVDLDWDQIDVGDEPEGGMRARGEMPLIPKLGFIAAAVILVMLLIAVVMVAVR